MKGNCLNLPSPVGINLRKRIRKLCPELRRSDLFIAVAITKSQSSVGATRVYGYIDDSFMVQLQTWNTGRSYGALG